MTHQIHPERKRRVRQALSFFSIAAWCTGIFLLILVARMIAEYIFHMDLPTWTKYVAQVHGGLYMIYLVTTLNLGTIARWQPTKWLITAIAGTIPFLSFFVEHSRRKEITQTFQLDS
ncbi:DUF3817 domain-containing protein [Corynebacterium sp. sy017]|uniref:DUF3817 domain-containing protein n=1 Tax=unclassified Corynebacterium TaxID=2624378 RepID=UPI001185E51E|nr:MULTISPECIES: DUF3817 domain-containing protein [unclassified Corynebacterium]MBP3088164.1 DUF3817 domain-containing protein [Corynebacterium sp. sy017]TSD92671.1 DUF3817 domain-containing protein [Corynebacterium sp. SY003]